MIPLIELQRLKALVYPLLVIAQITGAGGNPASIGESVLATACQVDRKTARRWLSALVDLGLLHRLKPKNGCILTPQARALFGLILPPNGDNLPRMEQNLPFSDPTTADSSHKTKIKDLKAVACSKGEGLPTHVESFPISPEILAALRSSGIGEPKRSALARLPWITPAYIAAWKDHLHRRRRLTPGLLICCLQSGDSPPQPEASTPILDRLLTSLEGS